MPPIAHDTLHELLKKYWGYDSLRSWQQEPIDSILTQQESLTVLPTGGGKSLCYQLPALALDGVCIVISPLISLMKDQVDALVDMGIGAAYYNSSLSVPERDAVIEQLCAGQLKLLYISPERLKDPAMLELLHSIALSFVVIDEAHCISHWGHDFRADYRELGRLKQEFAGIRVHAFTATATPEVQQDIVSQLGLTNPRRHIAAIDRPNLTYRVMPRTQAIGQISDILRRHEREAGIIYCLRRKDVESISETLNKKGFTTLPYHAGLSDDKRRKYQERFAQEKVDIMVATIAFGMGIDRSNIRYVIHAAMPKSVEHYQQETGRAGRDGLPAHCYLLYSGQDYRTWEYLFEQSPQRDVMKHKLSVLYHYCTQPQCRHRQLSVYFGQPYAKDSCGACDYCLGEVDMVEDPLIVGQKILSCVSRVRGQSFGFGAMHIVNVLRGKSSEQIEQRGHQDLSTFGIMKEESAAFVRFMIEQLIGQGFLARDPEYSTLSVTDSGRRLLRAELTPKLAKPLVAERKKEIAARRTEKRAREWAGVDQDLFAVLRQKRAELAAAKGVPAFIIFGDKTLKDMAQRRPATLTEMADVFGIGERKLRQYGGVFLETIRGWKG